MVEISSLLALHSTSDGGTPLANPRGEGGAGGKPVVTMDPRTVAKCAAALNLDELDVESLHETAELLPALLAELILAHRPQAPMDRGRAWLDAVRIGWGKAPFCSADLIKWMEQGVGAPQRAAMDASRALCRLRAGEGLTSSKLSAALRELPVSQIEVAGDRRGSALWCLRDSRG